MTDRPAVVPLAPDDPGPRPPERRDGPPGARWLLAAVVGLGGAMVLLIGGGTTPDPTPGNTLVTPAPATTMVGTAATLGEWVPELGAETLRIAYLDTDGQFVATEWEIGAVRPDLPGPGLGLYVVPDQVSFEPGGSRLAVSTGGALFIDNFTLDARVSGWAWHPSSPEVAWISQSAGSTDWVLFRQGTLTWSRAEVAEIRRLPGDDVTGVWSLSAWGDWGYAVTHTDHDAAGDGGSDPVEITLVLGPDGAVRHAFAGAVLAATAGGAMAIRGTPDILAQAIESGYAADEVTQGAPLVPVPAGWSMLDVDGSATALRAGGQRPAFARFTPDGGTLVALERQGDGRWAVVAVSGDDAERIQSVAEDHQPVGLSHGGRWALFTADGRLIFYDWANHRYRTVPFDLGEVIALDL